MLHFALLLALAAFATAQDKTCGPNEVFKSCGSACQPSCARPEIPKFCTAQCVIGCQCADGYIRDDVTKKCVKKEECSVKACGQNEVFKSCGSACQPSCARPEMPKWCTKQCVIGCQCADGYIRDDVTKKCVKKEECSVKACGQNEVFKSCGSACPPTCARPEIPMKCTKQCVIGCQCADGYIRDDQTQTCVKKEECSVKQCGANEEYRSCGTACPPTCSRPNPTWCTLQCVQGCQCKKGYYRDDMTNKCVKKEECSVKECQANAIFKQCGTMCPRKCSQRGIVPCPLICVPGCECAPGLVKEDFTGECVKVEECKQEECDMRTERYDQCSKACEKTCANPDNKICPAICWGGCMCQDGLYRHSNGKCVKREEC